MKVGARHVAQARLRFRLGVRVRERVAERVRVPVADLLRVRLRLAEAEGALEGLAGARDLDGDGAGVRERLAAALGDGAPVWLPVPLALPVALGDGVAVRLSVALDDGVPV